MKASGACDFGLFKHNLCSVLEPKTVRKCRTRVALEFSSCHPQSEVAPMICQCICQGGFFPPPPRMADSVWMRQRVGGLCALEGGTRQVKFGADQEGAHRQKRDRRAFPPPHVLRFSPRVNGQKLVREGKRKWRGSSHRTRGEMEAAARWIYAILLVGLSAQG